MQYNEFCGTNEGKGARGGKMWGKERKAREERKGN